jgi:hypothetical protein
MVLSKFLETIISLIGRYSTRTDYVSTLKYVCIIFYLWLRQRSRYSDSLRPVRPGDRISVGARFFAPAQTGPGAHPASYTMGIGSFTGVKRPGRGVDHPPHLTLKLKKE